MRIWHVSILAVVLVGSAVWANVAARSRVSEELAELLRKQNQDGSKIMPISKSDEEWRAQLTDEQYHVTRRKGTERAFTGKYWDHKEPGTYRCVCCSLELFDADTKYESGTGWPSFFNPLNHEHVKTEEDRKFWQTRTEVLCARCNAHLGHVFPDGPQPTGLRYCLNSAALDFEASEGEKESDEGTTP